VHWISLCAMLSNFEYMLLYSNFWFEISLKIKNGSFNKFRIVVCFFCTHQIITSSCITWPNIFKNKFTFKNNNAFRTFKCDWHLSCFWELTTNICHLYNSIFGKLKIYFISINHTYFITIFNSCRVIANVHICNNSILTLLLLNQAFINCACFNYFYFFESWSLIFWNFRSKLI